MRRLGNIFVGVAVWLSFMCKIVTARPNDVMPRSNRSDSSELRFIAIGDWGQGNQDQREIAKAMGKWCSSHRCDFIISTGDNFYPCGVDSVDHDFFKSRWRDVYTHPKIADLKWHMCAGNHDHGGGHDKKCKDPKYEVRYQVEYTNPRWHFPKLSYSFNKNAGTATIKFVSIDTESIRRGEDDNTSGFVDRELKEPNVKWKVVFGHHPFFSAGKKDTTRSRDKKLRAKILKVMQKHNADIYLSGHDHNHQHWQKAGTIDIDHILTGAGGKKLYHRNDKHKKKNEQQYGMKLRFFKAAFGFTYFVVTEKSISWKVLSKDLKILHKHTRTK